MTVELDKQLNKVSFGSVSLLIIGVVVWFAFVPVLGKPSWGILITTFLYAASITQGAFAIAIVLRVTSARWAASLYRLSSAIAVAFLPIGLILLITIFIGKGSIFYWADEPPHSLWFNYVFFIARHLILFTIVYFLAVKLFKISSNTKIAEKNRPAFNNQLLVYGFYLLLALAFYQTLISWDFGMVLNKHWTDTLYSLLFMITSLYGGIAFIALVMFFSKKYLSVNTFSNEDFENIAKLMLAFCIVWTFFWFTQYFNIWYVSIPEETEPLFLRIFGPYRPIFLVSLVLMSGVPFSSLIFSRIRKSTNAVALLSLSILSGVWLERYLMVVPALEHEHKVVKLFVLNPVNILFTLGILGGVSFFFMSRVKRNPQIFPDETLKATDSLYVDPKGWQ